MWIGNTNRRVLVDKVVENLLNEVSEVSYTLTVPPGFGERFVPQQIVGELKSSTKNPRVAFIALDEISSVDELLCQIGEQWSESNAWRKKHRSLGEVLSYFRDGDRQNIVVMSRFHKLLDFADEAILQSLRDAENATDIKTVVVSVYPLDWIKAEWESKNRALKLSDFGYEHSDRCCEKIPLSEFISQYSTHRDTSIPVELIKKSFSWAGGVPQHVNEIIEYWIDQGYKELSPKIETDLLSVAKRKASRFAKMLDKENDSKFLDLVVEAYMPPVNEIALNQFKIHPWGRLFVDENGLCSDALGECCVDQRIRHAINTYDENDPYTRQIYLAKDAYNRNQFSEASKLLESCADTINQTSISLLLQHSRIMDAFVGRGVDADWKSVIRLVGDARKIVEKSDIKTTDKRRLEIRYDELIELSKTVLEAHKGGSRRIVDSLTASDDCPESARAALTLLLLQLESAKSTRGNTEAISKAISMPEQIYRVWANWALNLDYNCVPNDSANWEKTSNNWAAVKKSELRIPKAGGKFPGFAVFAFYCVAKLAESASEELKNHAPFPDIDSLKKNQFVFDWRNDPAHASVVFDTKNRNKYLQLTEDWFGKLCQVFPPACLEVDDLHLNVRPLPVVSENQAVCKLVWG